ncbi:MAG: hypothetical protein WBP59_17725 [Ilumatobacteraceae bacterium]
MTVPKAASPIALHFAADGWVTPGWNWQTRRMLHRVSRPLTTMRRPMSIGTAAAALGALALLAGCGGSAAKSGETVIEEKLAEDIGLGDLDAECTEPDGLREGETFTCEATTEDGTEIFFLGTMTSDDEFDIITTNLLSASDVDAIRTEGARVLTPEAGVELSADDIQCPDEVVVLDDTGDFECEITDPTNGAVFELVISTGGITPGEGVNELYFQVGDEKS